jgi:hypothetical protein
MSNSPRPALFQNFRWGFSGEIQSMLVENGRVVARGEIPAFPHAEVFDLSDHWVMPAFADAHCHILPGGLDLAKPDLALFASREAVLDALQDRLAGLTPGKWLMAVHYDQSRFPDGRDITRQELDSLSADRPILLTHSSLHSGIANSAALNAAGVRPDEPDGPSGVYGRDAAGELNGLLLEDAYHRVFRATTKPSLPEMVEAILAAGRIMASRGILCAADMMTGYSDLLMELEAYRQAAERGNPVRVRLYAQWGSLFGPRRAEPSALRDALAGLEAVGVRLAGVKIFEDGAIASNTAAIYGRYAEDRQVVRTLSRFARSAQNDAPPGVEVSGQLIYAPDRLNTMVRTAHEAGLQVAVHSIGDFSTDLVMAAFDAVDEPSRHRIEHAMLLSDAQIDHMAHIGCYCSMQPDFLPRFNPAYHSRLGPRASALNRLRSVAEAGIKLSLSSDWPVTGGDPLVGVRSAAQRPAGFDPAENIEVAQALERYSVAGAQALRETEFGELRAGQWADFLVFAHDPRQLPAVCMGVFREGAKLT